MSAQEDASVAVSCLGAHLVAFAIEERSPSRVKRIAEGEEGATAIETHRLNQLAQWVTKLRQLESDRTIRALSIGMWPDLNDEAPIELFRNGQGQRALEAARSYY